MYMYTCSTTSIHIAWLTSRFVNCFPSNNFRIDEQPFKIFRDLLNFDVIYFLLNQEVQVGRWRASYVQTVSRRPKRDTENRPVNRTILRNRDFIAETDRANGTEQRVMRPLNNRVVQTTVSVLSHDFTRTLSKSCVSNTRVHKTSR